MKYLKLALNLMMCLSIGFALQAAELIISLSTGEQAILTINENDRFLDVMEQANLLTHQVKFEETFFLDCSNHAKILLATGGESSRDYQRKTSSKEQEDIAYIVTTLGSDSLTSIWRKEGSLKKAGNRIEHIHPLRFLGYIFSEEKTKVGLLQIKERGGKISKEFFGNLHSNLTKEAKVDNLKAEYVQDFARQLKIDSGAITKAINANNWSEFVDILIKLLPRTGNQGRYGM